MLKRQNPSDEAPPGKRIRKPAGFRLARLAPTSSALPDPVVPPNTSFFVTPPPEIQDGTATSGEQHTDKPRRNRKTTNAHRLTEWLKFRAAFLDETLRHDGLGDFLGQTKCSRCGDAAGIIKCRDCADGALLKCPECAVSSHANHPLHRVERWNGEFFDKASLQSLGYRYQLGHSGAACPCPQPGPKNFIVFSISGPHFVSINYCHCHDEPLSTWQQLLREGWFPATLSRPQTVFTFDCLESFHELTLQGKTNLYDYYHTLLRRGDNANLSNPIYRYPEFHRVFRMWRNLMALKRAGRGHDPAGIDATSNGELLVECPACPHPGRNLPDDWEKAGALLFLYTLYIAVDGNFKLKGKQRYLKDVELMPGWGAYVPEQDYQDHIANYVDEPEVCAKIFA
ncbi:hypothetical protein GALMADRAFT_82040 [Galerina marginata CBS 339.88]|uniref:CxC2-like cysteine cluster KDZ transposase-associated domain-containing protein n=1 Tax=Galerina marginata (strain CBS 339.88) TaxID=685588 RepID=A0A067S376_GALM3|nr:hypothetical protein GALMADRAFT_82040 [Galerina marginata CBS 339.88]